MPTFVVEAYLSIAAEALESARARAERAASADVRYVRTTILGDDDTCLHTFEAPSRELLEQAMRDAGLEHDRIAEAIEKPADDRKGTR